MYKDVFWRLTLCLAMESLLQSVCGIHHTTQSTARDVLGGQETKDCGKVPRHADPDGTTDTNSVGELGSQQTPFHSIADRSLPEGDPGT